MRVRGEGVRVERRGHGRDHRDVDFVKRDDVEQDYEYGHSHVLGSTATAFSLVHEWAMPASVEPSDHR